MRLTEEQLCGVVRVVVLARELLRILEADRLPAQTAERDLLDALIDLEASGFLTEVGSS